MSKLADFLGIDLRFCDDFAADAHVHISYKDYRAVMIADRCAIISGSVPPRVAGLVTEWMMINNATVKSNWEAHKRGSDSLTPIRPLVD